MLQKYCFFCFFTKCHLFIFLMAMVYLCKFKQLSHTMNEVKLSHNSFRKRMCIADITSGFDGFILRCCKFEAIWIFLFQHTYCIHSRANDSTKSSNMFDSVWLWIIWHFLVALFQSVVNDNLSFSGCLIVWFLTACHMILLCSAISKCR